jgi:hypothetical protein
MMGDRFSPAAFSTTFCLVYVLCLAMNWPLFMYFPLHSDFTWGNRVLADAGPGMAWYGLMASSLPIALVVSYATGRAAFWIAIRSHLWLFACFAMLAIVFLLRRFFI